MVVVVLRADRREAKLRLLLWILLQSTYHVLRCISVVAFFGSYTVTIVIRSRCILHLCILLATEGSDAAIILLIMMVPIDSSRQELSNGCHIVLWSNFDLLVEIPAVALIWRLLATF